MLDTTHFKKFMKIENQKINGDKQTCNNSNLSFKIAGSYQS